MERRHGEWHKGQDVYKRQNFPPFTAIGALNVADELSDKVGGVIAVSYTHLLFNDPTLKTQLTADELKESEAKDLPNFVISIIPIALILILFNGFKWTVEGAVFAGVAAATILMFKRIKGGVKEWVSVFNKGAADSGVAILNTAIVVGFGGVVQNTEGFTNLIAKVQSMNISPVSYTHLRNFYRIFYQDKPGCF